MGFEFSIKLHLSLCETTGKPFTWTYTDTHITQNYDFSTITVPEPYRRFTTMKGHVFHLYTTEVLQRETSHADISELLEYFPDWKDIQAELDDDEEWWKEEDHRLFHEAFVWFTTQSQAFYAEWSY